MTRSYPPLDFLKKFPGPWRVGHVVAVTRKSKSEWEIEMKIKMKFVDNNIAATDTNSQTATITWPKDVRKFRKL